MKIGISCWPTYGGSGVIAAELGMNLAQRGYEVHFITYAPPERLNLYQVGIYYHEVTVPDYPLFEYPPYSQALASKMANVAKDYHLDLIHSHYAIPHAASALLAKEILGGKLKVITTLHGTDITLVGSDPSFKPVVNYSIRRSDGVTAVSRYLQAEIYKVFTNERVVDVIYNFINPQDYKDLNPQVVRQRFAMKNEKLLVHISNFRPVKRISDVVKVFLYIHKELPVKLILIGNGPELPKAERMVRDAGVEDDVVCLGTISNVLNVISACDVLLLPSEVESFGLAALEAMGCGVPVVGSASGGLPEVVENGFSGFLVEVGDVKSMAEATLKLLTDENLRQRMGESARQRAFKLFNISDIVDQYEEIYHKVILAC